MKSESPKEAKKGEKNKPRPKGKYKTKTKWQI